MHIIGGINNQKSNCKSINWNKKIQPLANILPAELECRASQSKFDGIKNTVKHKISFEKRLIFRFKKSFIIR